MLPIEPISEPCRQITVSLSEGPAEQCGCRASALGDWPAGLAHRVAHASQKHPVGYPLQAVGAASCPTPWLWHNPGAVTASILHRLGAKPDGKITPTDPPQQRLVEGVLLGFCTGEQRGSKAVRP